VDDPDREPPALLVDYGEVISRPQRPGALARLAALAGADPAGFTMRYWEHRPDYDRGVAAASYWSAVAGRELSDPALIESLMALDLESWSDLNTETLEVLAHAQARGSSLSLLSNAPHDLAEALDRHPALTGFERLMFSSRIGVIKPEAAVFEAALAEIGRPASEVIFIDDRPANVEGARALGMRAILFTSAGRLRGELFGGG
jgi:putative hydrolase of the HAD superfamily